MTSALNQISSVANQLTYQITHDFDAQAELLRGWNQDYLQMSSGNFSGYVSEIKFDDVHLFLEYTSQALFQHGQLPEDVLAIGVPLAAKSQGVFCGSATNSNSIHIFSGHDGFEFYSPSELVMAGISVNRSALLSLLTAEEQESVQKNCAQAHLLQLDPTGLEAMRSFMRDIFHTVQATPAVLHNRQITTALRTSLLSLLADNLTHSFDTDPAPISTARCWKIVTESRELALSHAENPVSVAELCQHFGISRRTLQYCFHNLIGTSPVAYLRAERLNAVRHMLKDADSVTDAATYWGFWHFGHFSQEYKKMFGELPSTTFKRLHALN